jgi:hypothetical protein
VEAEKLESEKVRKLIFQMSKLKNQLQRMGVVKSGGKIVADYAEWFCSVKFGLELCDKNKFGYDALSKFGKKILIRSKIGSDIDFKTNFDEFQADEFDYLLIVFINEATWMIDSIYKVAHDVVTKFLTSCRDKKFEWRRESRSLSLKLYPDEENTLPPVF